MTLYLVKHGFNEYRLHKEDGTQVGVTTWNERPTQMDMVDALAEDYNGASILNNPDAREQYTAIVTDSVAFRDVDEHGQSEVPW